MIITAIKITCIILAIVLIVLVILQQGKGSDLGSAFGGGSSNSMFGAVGPSNFLGKLTAFIAALFLILNLAQAVLLKNANTEVLFTDEEIQEGDLVWVRDQEHKRPLAVGWAVKDGSSLVKELKGKGLKNIHWVGDELWEMEL